MSSPHIIRNPLVFPAKFLLHIIILQQIDCLSFFKAGKGHDQFFGRKTADFMADSLRLVLPSASRLQSVKIKFGSTINSPDAYQATKL